MLTPCFRLSLLAVTLILSGGAHLLRAQVDFKGERPSNPLVNVNHRQARPKVGAGAVRQTRRTQSTEPDSSDVEELIERGNAARDSRRFAQAAQLYQRAATLGNDSRAYFGLGNVYFDQQIYERAKTAYLRTIQLKPDDAEARFYLAIIYYSTRDISEAIEQFKQVTRLTPDDVKAYNYLAIIYEGQERYPEAIELFKRLIALKPNDSAAQNNLAALYARLGDKFLAQQRYPEAIEQYKLSIPYQPRPDVYRGLGNAYAGLQRYQEAVESYRRAIQLNADYVEAYLDLGDLYAAQQRDADAAAEYNRAIEVSRQAVSSDFENAYAHYNLGLAYLRVRNRAGASEQQRILQRQDSRLARQLLNEMNLRH